MSHFGSGLEQGLHCLLHLVGEASAAGDGGGADNAAVRPSARDLAAFQGVSPSYVAKLFTLLEKAGLVESAGGVRGGYRLARPAPDITVLQVADAIEGEKPLFRCRDIRANCILYADDPPPWATGGTCGIHAVMIQAERAMRASLDGVTLADLAERTAAKIPAGIGVAARDWFARRAAARTGGRTGPGADSDAGEQAGGGQARGGQAGGKRA